MQHWTQLECTGEAPSKRLGHTSVYNQGHMYIFGGTVSFYLLVVVMRTSSYH